MRSSTNSMFWIIWKLIVLSLFLSPFIGSSYGLDELLHDYDSPQALAMGNAWSADARGHVANYYNPAGVAKEFRRTWEVIPVAIDTILGGGALSSIVASRSLGLKRILDDLQTHPGRYAYGRFNLMPAVSRRNFAVSLLASNWFAARSDGTTVDTDSGTDVGASLGWGINLAGNTLKFGVSLRAFVRNQLKGSFNHSALGTDVAIDTLKKEGYGFGVNVGMLVSLPMKYLPTLAFVVKDALDTQFFASNFMNASSTTAPDTVNRSFNVAMALHPNLGRGVKGTIAVEAKNLELIDVDWRKRVHAGIQLETDRNVYLWLGANQLYWTAGVGWRVKGGDLECGSYGQDVGVGSNREQDRRFFLRYTIDF